MDTDGLALPMTADQLDDSDDLARSLKLARAGDAAAFERILRRHERLVFRTALRLLGRREDAEDAAQEVFLRLHRHLGRFDETRDLAPWLYRVTVNVCRDIGRKRRPEVPVDDLALAAETDPRDQADRAGQRRIVSAGLRRLPPKERAALVLRDLEGLSTAEVARILGSSEATVRSQVSTARVKIRNFADRFLRRRV